MRTYYVYIMASLNRITYIGVTNDLVRRVAEHKDSRKQGFTSKYKCRSLVYYEENSNIEDAIQREKQLKNWRREWKLKLIEKENPGWLDLAEDW